MLVLTFKCVELSNKVLFAAPVLEEACVFALPNLVESHDEEGLAYGWNWLLNWASIILRLGLSIRHSVKSSI